LVDLMGGCGRLNKGCGGHEVRGWCGTRSSKKVNRNQHHNQKGGSLGCSHKNRGHLRGEGVLKFVYEKRVQGRKKKRRRGERHSKKTQGGWDKKKKK